MEYPPRHSPDDDSGHPEAERLYPGEIDLTGAIPQEEALLSMIGDAMTEAESSGEIPEWGARGLARALANRLADPTSGALHHFAVTGRVDKHAMLHEIEGIYNATMDHEIQLWTILLGVYLDQLDPSSAEPDDPEVELIVHGSARAKVSHYFRSVFAEADARGEPISHGDAQAIATIFGGILGINSATHRFAETGDIDSAKIREECEYLKANTPQTPDVRTWAQRLEDYLDAREKPPETPSA